MAERLRPGYQVRRLGLPLDDADGATRTFGQVSALIKDYDPETFEIANEYVCSRLAIGLGLPTPPGDFAEVYASDKLCWVSPLAMAETPPPADIAELCDKESKVAAGIVVFDTLVGNLDRHDWNLIYSGRYGLWMIDHGQSLYYKGDEPASGLASAVDQGIGEHLLRPYVKSVHLGDWCNRVKVLPKKAISSAVEPVRRLGLVSDGHAAAIVGYVDERARRIASLVGIEQQASNKRHNSEEFSTPRLTDGIDS